MNTILRAWVQGVLLGLGIAAPFGPINVEIVRRHLSAGLPAGLLLGFGACSVDTAYIVLISLGLITARPGRRVQGVLLLAGSAILALLAVKILHSAAGTVWPAAGTQPALEVAAASWRHYVVGVLMTASSPMNLVFWLGVIAGGQYLGETAWGPWPRVMGVMSGTVGWVVGLNLVLLAGRGLLTPTVVAGVNILSAAILLGFAGRGAWRFVQLSRVNN